MTDQDAVRETVAADLTAYAIETEAAVIRRSKEAMVEWHALHDLLIRARDAGLRNKDIANALNGADAEDVGGTALSAPPEMDGTGNHQTYEGCRIHV